VSRSYKKNPWLKDRNPWAKRMANKKVRRFKKDLANGNAYKKVSCSYNICDYKWRTTLFEHLESEKRWAEEINISRRWFVRSIGEYEYDEKKEIKNWKKHHYWK